MILAPAEGGRPSLGARHRLRSYLAYLHLQAATVRIYRADFLFELAALLMQVYLLRVVWVAVYGHRHSVAGVTLTEQIAYSTLVTVQAAVVTPWGSYSLVQRVRDGTVGMDLLRPIGFLEQVVVGQAGGAAASLPYAVVVLPFAVLVGGAVAPASAVAGAEYALALLVGWAVASLLNTVAGMLAFWTLEVSGALMVYSMVSSFLAGALVPLWFMPGPLRAVAEVLPFQASSYAPLEIYLGRVHGLGALGLLGEEIAWAIVTWLVLRVVWSRALRRVVVQGG